MSNAHFMCDKIKELRINKGWSIENLSNSCGTTKSYLQNLESGKCRNPSIGKLLDIANALGVHASFLFDDHSENIVDARNAHLLIKINNLNEYKREYVEKLIDLFSGL